MIVYFSIILCLKSLYASCLAKLANMLTFAKLAHVKVLWIYYRTWMNNKTEALTLTGGSLHHFQTPTTPSHHPLSTHTHIYICNIFLVSAFYFSIQHFTMPIVFSVTIQHFTMPILISVTMQVFLQYQVSFSMPIYSVTDMAPYK